MILNSSLKRLEGGPFRPPSDGSCPGCFHRKKGLLSVHEGAPLPEPCAICDRIPEAVIFLYFPTDDTQKEPPEVLKKARVLAVFPDNGRGARKPRDHHPE